MQWEDAGAYLLGLTEENNLEARRGTQKNSNCHLPNRQLQPLEPVQVQGEGVSCWQVLHLVALCAFDPLSGPRVIVMNSDLQRNR